MFTFLFGVMPSVGLGGDLEVIEHTGDLSLSSRGGVAGGVGRSSSSSSSSNLETFWRPSSMETSVDLLLESSMLSNEVLRLTSAASLIFRGSVLILKGSLLILEATEKSRSTSSVCTVIVFVAGNTGSGTLTLTLAREAVSILMASGLFFFVLLFDVTTGIVRSSSSPLIRSLREAVRLNCLKVENVGFSLISGLGLPLASVVVEVECCFCLTSLSLEAAVSRSIVVSRF